MNRWSREKEAAGKIRGVGNHSAVHHYDLPRWNVR